MEIIERFSEYGKHHGEYGGHSGERVLCTNTEGIVTNLKALFVLTYLPR